MGYTKLQVAIDKTTVLNINTIKLLRFDVQLYYYKCWGHIIPDRCHGMPDTLMVARDGMDFDATICRGVVSHGIA